MVYTAWHPWDSSLLYCGVNVGIPQEVHCWAVSKDLDWDCIPHWAGRWSVMSLAFSNFCVHTLSACLHCLATFPLCHSTLMSLHSLSRSLEQCLYTLYGTSLGTGADLVCAALIVFLTSTRVGSLILIDAYFEAQVSCSHDSGHKLLNSSLHIV